MTRPGIGIRLTMAQAMARRLTNPSSGIAGAAAPRRAGQRPLSVAAAGMRYCRAVAAGGRAHQRHVP